MKVTVLGGNGFIGARLVAELRSLGCVVNVSSSSNGSGISPSSGLLPDDYAIPEATEAVVYLAQSPHFRAVPEQASHLMAVNNLSAVRAAVAGRRVGIQRFVYVSTGTVYEPSFQPLSEASALDRSSWYALSKIHGEECVRLFRDDFDVFVCRPFAVYGEGQQGRLIPNLIQSVRLGNAITLQPNHAKAADGGLKISLTHVDDVTRALAKLALSGGPSTINLAGEEYLSVADIARLISTKLNLELSFIEAQAPRKGDLVSDTITFSKFYDRKMTTFSEGLDRVIASLT
jgi:UDP-glucose 4-epimerase